MKVFLKTLQARLRDPRQFSVKSPDRICPICGYEGRFLSLGTPPRWDGRCPNCSSRERHRLLHICLEREGIDLTDGRSILHFAPEGYFKKMMGDSPAYHTADLVPGKARHAMDMADMTFDENSVDVVIANHVLEHVPDDRKALRESLRVLKPGGLAIFTVPQNWARAETYENPDVISAADKYAHYDDASHVRYYGRDFADRVKEAGFEVTEWRLPPEEEPRYGLFKQDIIYLCRKPA